MTGQVRFVGAVHEEENASKAEATRESSLSMRRLTVMHPKAVRMIHCQHRIRGTVGIALLVTRWLFCVLVTLLIITAAPFHASSVTARSYPTKEHSPLSPKVERKFLKKPLENSKTGDFDDLNKLLEGAVVRLPNVRVDSNLVVLYLEDIRCTNFTVDQVLLKSETVQQSAHDTFETTQVQLAMEGLGMICYLDYTYEFVFVRSGTADLYSRQNMATVTMDFTRQKLIDNSPATSVSLEECLPNFNVNDLDFRGDISALVFDTVEKLMRNSVEREAEKRLCAELDAMSKTLINDMLEKADNVLALYYNVNMDPLRVEEELQIPDNIRLMDLQDDSRATSKWLDKLLLYAIDFATKIVPDVNGEDDMNANVFIRDNFLQDGAFVLDTNLEVLENHNKFLDTRVVVDRVKVYGLDQIKSFEPFLEVGKYTIQNKLSWSILTVELDVSITIKASSKEDSIFASPSAAGTNEKVKITFGVQNVDIILSALLAVDEKALGALRLGSLLYSDKVLDCLLSAVYDIQISGLSLQAADIQPPVMEGFVARGIDRIVSDLTDAAFLIYESAVLEAAPGFFNTVLRDFANEILEDFVRVDVTCFIPIRVGGTSDGFVDFRDFLLPPNESLAAGGMGTSPYGDLPHTLVSQIKDQFFSNDDYGKPKVNNFIREAIRKTSNRTDVVIELGDILDWNTTMSIAGLEALVGIKVQDASIGNLDTFDSPLELFQPVVDQANMLNNSISVGGESKPLSLTARLLITATDYDGLQLNNEVVVRLDLGGARLMALVFLQILEDPLLSVPIEDTLNWNCWLATLLPDATQVNRALLAKHAFSLDQLLLNITCLSCTSPNFDDLIYGLYSPEDVGNATSKVLNILSLLRESDFLRVSTDTVIGGASKQCPHNSDYDPDFSYTSLLVESGGDEFRHGVGERDERVAYFNMACAILTVFIVLIFICVRKVARHRHRVWRHSLPDEAQARLDRRKQTEAENDTRLNQSTQPMFRSEELPRNTRMLVPFAIVFTIGVQAIGHFALLSYIDVEGQIAGESFAIHRFLEFRFVEAALRSYRSGGKEMGLLLFVFTGVWPYLKLATCMVLWFVSPQTISVSTRGSVLLWLDVLAKLSMVDILATLLVVAVFLIYIGGVAERQLSSGEFFATRLIIVPCAGFYCIVVAQRLTRISSTYLLNWHQLIVASTLAPRRNLKDVPSLDTLDTAGTSGEVSNNSWMQDFDGTSSPERVVRVDADGKTTRGFWVYQNGSWMRRTSELVADEELESNGSVREDCQDVSSGSIEDSDSHIGPEPCRSDASESAGTIREAKQEGRRRRIAIGMTGVTVLILAVIGCILAPSISLDAKTLWGLFESGKTFDEVVSDYPLFRVVCSILVEARLVLDSAAAKAGLGILLGLAVLSTIAFPLMKVIQSLSDWKEQRLVDPDGLETTAHYNVDEATPSRNALLASQCRRMLASCFNMVRCIRERLRNWYNWCKGQSYEAFDEEDIDLLPAYKIKAWRYMEVYVAAFVIAIWQLGAVAVYVIHQYCSILDLSFETLVFLGLIEDTSSECFREQASSPSFIAILVTAFVVLMVSFFSEAIGHYREAVARAEKALKGEITEK